MGEHRLWTMELESRQDTCWFHALGIHQAVQWIGSVLASWEGVQHIYQLKREQLSKFHAYHVNYLNLDGVRV